MSNFGKQLKRLIQAFNLKYATVAHAATYDASYISKWVNSEVLPTPSAVPEICEAVAGLIVSSCSEVQIRDNCPLTGFTNLPSREELQERLRSLLIEAYRKDSAPKAFAHAGAKSVVPDRTQVLPECLSKLRQQQDELHMIILGDIPLLSIEDIIFLMDLRTHINELGFTDGSIEILISEYSIDHIDDARVMVALLNLLMLPSGIPLSVSRSLTRQTGLIIVADNVLYRAQCRMNSGWLMETLSLDPSDISRVMQLISAQILPPSRALYTRYAISDPSASGDLSTSYWGRKEWQLIGTFGTLFCANDLPECLLTKLAEYRTACHRQQRSLVQMLESGRDHRCIIYREALDNLVYRGTFRLVDKEISLSPSMRLTYLQSLASKLDRYPNLKMRLIDGYFVKEIKHRPLPNVFLSKSVCGFLTFPEDDISAYCLVHNTQFRQALKRMFVQLWEDDTVPLIDIRDVMDDYLSFCQDLTLGEV